MSLLARCAFGLLCILWGHPANPQALESIASPLTTDQIVERMVRMNDRRTRDLESYTASRTYHLKYKGLYSTSADVDATLTYEWPDKKHFDVLSEHGSELLRKRVLRPLLAAELEALKEENRKQAAMRPENYTFLAAGYEKTPEGNFYVLEIRPKNQNKFLVRGRIWVDAEDFGIARIEGEPSVNPSWWTKRNSIHVSYQKVGEFWLPLHNDTESNLRMLGRSWLTIDYTDYKILRVHQGESARTVEEFSPASASKP